jgi:site-specific DNA recombinase
MKQAIGYIRVSTEKQANEGVSLEAQEAKIVTWCKANGYELVKVYVDAGISGKRMDTRKELLAALASLKKGMALVSYSLSRLARSTKDALAIGEAVAKKKADMVSLSEQIDTTTAAGNMMFQMLAVLAEFERNLTAERTTRRPAAQEALPARSTPTRHPTALKPSRAAWSRSSRKPRSWPRFKRRGRAAAPCKLLPTA